MKTSPLVFIFLLCLVLSCKHEPDSPEKVLEEYTTSLAAGDCERALELSTGESQEGARYLQEQGCQGWHQQVLSVSCEEHESTATCHIRIKRDAYQGHSAGTYNYTYSMEKTDDAWKVSDQWKDFNKSEEEIDAMNLDSLENPG